MVIILKFKHLSNYTSNMINRNGIQESISSITKNLNQKFFYNKL